MSQYYTYNGILIILLNIVMLKYFRPSFKKKKKKDPPVPIKKFSPTLLKYKRHLYESNVYNKFYLYCYALVTLCFTKWSSSYTLISHKFLP